MNYSQLIKLAQLFYRYATGSDTLETIKSLQPDYLMYERSNFPRNKEDMSDDLNIIFNKFMNAYMVILILYLN